MEVLAGEVFRHVGEVAVGAAVAIVGGEELAQFGFEGLRLLRLVLLLLWLKGARSVDVF